MYLVLDLVLLFTSDNYDHLKKMSKVVMFKIHKEERHINWIWDIKISWTCREHSAYNMLEVFSMGTIMYLLIRKWGKKWTYLRLERFISRRLQHLMVSSQHNNKNKKKKNMIILFMPILFSHFKVLLFLEFFLFPECFDIP